MNRISIVMKRDYRELRQTTAFRIMAVVAAAVMLAASVGISIGLSLQSWLGEPEARPLLELFIGLVVYFLPLLVLLAFVWSFANLPVIKEKVNGNIESLMATPLSPRNLWLGKTLSIFLPAYTISIVAAVIVVLAVNLTAILPATGGFVLPIPTLLLGFVVNPLLFFGLLLFMILFSLACNPDIAMAPSFIIGFGLMMGVPAGLGTGLIDISSWSFVLWYLAGTVILWVLVYYFSRLLTKENIVLSSKGG
jgi:ABC-type transport system involved in multi-copper enzyme maturation permease subunit